MAVQSENGKFIDFRSVYSAKDSSDCGSNSSPRTKKQRSRSAKVSPFNLSKFTKKRSRNAFSECGPHHKDNNTVVPSANENDKGSAGDEENMKKTKNHRLGHIGKSIKRLILPNSSSNSKPPSPPPPIPKRSSSLRDIDMISDHRFPTTTTTDSFCRVQSSEDISTIRSSPKCNIVAVEFIKPPESEFQNDLKKTEQRVQLLMARDAPSFGWAMRASNRKIASKEKKINLNTEEEILRLKQDHVIKRAESKEIPQEEKPEELQLDIGEKLVKEKARCVELEQLLEMKNIQQNIIDTCIFIEKEKLTTLKNNFQEERSKRLAVEQKLHCCHENINDSPPDPCPSSPIPSPVKLRRKRPTGDSKSVGNTMPHSRSESHVKRRTWPYNLSLPSQFSATNADDDFDLYRHVVGLGHDVGNCTDVRINSYSCRGYLHKVGRRRALTSSCKKRWFVFHRKMRALCYYDDRNKRTPKHMIYFQSIQEVYVDAAAPRSRGNGERRFCVQTSERVYLLGAPSLVAMGIWMDVLCTGREGALDSM